MAFDNEAGGPAFPTQPNSQPGVYIHHGMSLRDYFAGQALNALIQNGHDKAGAVEYAYSTADAMLIARAKP